MNKVQSYRRQLRALSDWEFFLLQNSALPGPRSNLELAQAAAAEGTLRQFQRWVSLDAGQAPENTPGVFLVICGAIGLGRLTAEGQRAHLSTLRRLAGDGRWRVREAVAMALQRIGVEDSGALLEEMEIWCMGSALEQRAAIAGLCEPDLLRQREVALAVLTLLDRVTSYLSNLDDRRSDAFRVLRQGLGYCWSVAIVAVPTDGKAAFEKWLDSGDRDVRWVLRKNLQKKRLLRMDEVWVKAALRRLDPET